MVLNKCTYFITCYRIRKNLSVREVEVLNQTFHKKSIVETLIPIPPLSEQTKNYFKAIEAIFNQHRQH